MHHGKAFHARMIENIGQLPLVRLEVVQLGTGHQYSVTFKEVVMKAGISKRHAVCHQNQVGFFKERRSRGNKGKLNRPVPQHRLLVHLRTRVSLGTLLYFKLSNRTRRAAAGKPVRDWLFLSR